MDLAAFQQSAFLQSLGWAIANSIWQAGIFWILYHSAISSYTNASSKLKNNISTVFLFGSFLWFLVTFFNKFVYSEKLSASLPQQLFISADSNSTHTVLNSQNVIKAFSYSLPYLSVAYLFLLLIFTVKLINSYCNTISIRNHGLQKPTVEWRLFVDKVTRSMDITKKIRLWFSNHVDVPATIGFIKPVILIPIASLNQLTADQLEAIILHELSHIKRNDYALNLFISLVETILFFNPFVVLLCKIIKKERENCCDDFVLQYKYDRHSYASALLSLEKSRIQNQYLALTATSGKKQLLFRIKRIMEFKSNSNRMNYGQKLIALLLITGIIYSVAWLSPGKKTNKSYTSKLSVTTFKARPREDTGKTIIFKGKRDQATTVIPFKLIKEKQVILMQSENDLKDDKEGASFSRQMNDITKDNFELEDLAFDRAMPVPKATNIYNAAIAFNAHDNLFFLDRLPSTGLQFLKEFNFNIDFKSIQEALEKTNQSISSIDLQTLQQKVFESFERNKLPQLKIEKERVVVDLERHKDRWENVRKNFEYNFRHKTNDDLTNWHINSMPIDSSFTNQNYSIDKTKMVYRAYINRSPNQPKKRSKTMKISHDVNHPERFMNNDSKYYFYISNKEKRPVNHSIQIDYEKKFIIIDEKKINLAEIKEQ
jgi:beta-lactamase regulating signal transducer with metallopeptidase domain